jgi:microcystin degradation protein MlrC
MPQLAATKRVLIAMFMHETNTFSILPTDRAAYEARSLLYGDDIVRKYAGTKTELAAFLDGARRHGWEAIPVIAADATPSGKLTRDVYEYVVDKILDGINQAQAAGPLDAILLSLHGAMVAEHTFDGEGTLLGRIRALVGANLPVGVTLDLHANCTDAMAAHADIIVSYRTYPHVDHYEIASECVDLMARTLNGGIHPRTLVARGRQIDGVDKGRTTAPGPMTEAIALVRGFMTDKRVLSASINCGFPWADIPEAGPTAVLVVDGDSPDFSALLQRAVQHLWDTRHRQTVRFFTAAEAVAIARAKGRAGAPVVLADFADNPGGGGYGDTPGLLRAMIEAKLENAAFSPFYDPGSAAQCHAAGAGKTIALKLGGKIDPAAFGGPIEVRAEILKVFDGRLVMEGPMLAGVPFQLGPSAVVRVGGIDIVLGSRRVQNFDQQYFKAAGIEPRDRAVLGLKSMQHFRAAYAPIAGEIVVVDEGNGCCSERFGRLAYRHVRRPVFPLDLA